MATRNGGTITLEKEIRILSNAAAVGQKEGEGPLKNEFDLIFEDNKLGQASWEKAESELLSMAVKKALSNGNAEKSEVDAVFSGDLLDQCIGSSFSLRGFARPVCGLYGACSTMALSLCMASLAIETGGFRQCIAATCSHFCSAERQFRFPLEYGGQRTPTSQWTVTGAGAALLTESSNKNLPLIEKVHLGTICDLGITDANNMGAAMAPAAKKTIADFFCDTNTAPEDYDLILTGDLGQVGSDLLKELMLKEEGIDLSPVHNDCGLLIFDRRTQDVHAGGSGCGCSASVLCSYILNRIKSGMLRNVLFVATGALMSPTSSLQGESIPGIAHAVLISGRK